MNSIYPNIEPIAANATHRELEDGGMHETLLASIAMSLKRIADVLAGDDKHLDITNGIMQAIEQGIRSAQS